MTTINDINDLANILRDHPDWADTLRSLLLTQELKDLPAKFAQMVDAMNTITPKLDRLEEGQNRLEEKQDRMDTRLVNVENHVRTLTQDLRTLTQDVGTLKQDVGALKGGQARAGAERDTRRMARTVNCRLVTLKDQDWLEDLLENNGGGLSPGDQDSFINADLVIEAVHRLTREICYITAEVSYTAHNEDVARAVRNADLVRRFTGKETFAIVAAHSFAISAGPAFASGRAHIFELESRHLQPD